MSSDLTNLSSGVSSVVTRRRTVIFLACLGAVCAAAAYVGAVPTRKFGHDLFFLLDNGWRVVNGQRPHIDFTSAWGALSFLVVGAGMAISDGSVNAIGYANACLAFVVSLWGYRLSGDVVPFVPRLFICLYLALLIVSPYPLGWGALSSSHAMYYNRYGYALLGLLMIEAFLMEGKSQHTRLLGGFSTGMVTALSLFLKANYFAAAILLIAASFLWRPVTKQRLIGITVGFGLVSLIFLAYLQFDVGIILSDLGIAAGARSNSFSYEELARKFFLNAANLMFVLLLAIQNFRVKGGEVSGPRRFAGVFIGCVVFAVDMLLLCSNQQYFELPLTTIYSLWIVAGLMVQNGGVRRANRAARITIMVGAAFFLVSLCTQVTGLVYGVMQKADPADIHTVTRFTDPRLQSLLLYDDAAEPDSNGRQYVESLNDGLRLLRQNSAPLEKVLTMDMMNPFPYAMGRPAPRGGMAAVAYNYTFSDSHRPSDARFFGDADIVMVPKRPAAPGRMNEGLLRIYGPGLQARFRLAAESNRWYLFRHK